MQTEKSLPEGKRKMPKTRFTEFPALSIDQRVGISWSASETDLIIFLTYDIKNYYLSFINSFFFSSPEHAQGELLGYRDVRRPSYVWTSVTSETSETYETSEMSVRQLFSLCTL